MEGVPPDGAAAGGGVVGAGVDGAGVVVWPSAVMALAKKSKTIVEIVTLTRFIGGLPPVG
jgi:hypothetical protein